MDSTQSQAAGNGLNKSPFIPKSVSPAKTVRLELLHARNMLCLTSSRSGNTSEPYIQTKLGSYLIPLQGPKRNQTLHFIQPNTTTPTSNKNPKTLSQAKNNSRSFLKIFPHSKTRPKKLFHKLSRARAHPALKMWTPLLSREKNLPR